MGYLLWLKVHHTLSSWFVSLGLTLSTLLQVPQEPASKPCPLALPLRPSSPLHAPSQALVFDFTFFVALLCCLLSSPISSPSWVPIPLSTSHLLLIASKPCFSCYRPWHNPHGSPKYVQPTQWTRLLFIQSHMAWLLLLSYSC